MNRRKLWSSGLRDGRLGFFKTREGVLLAGSEKQLTTCREEESE